MNPEIRAKIEAAQKATGLDAQGLLNMLLDAGIAEVPQDLIDPQLTVERLGQRMDLELAEVPEDKIPEWFANLVPAQKAALICHLKRKGMSAHTIAKDLEINSAFVTKVFNKYAENIGANVISMRAETLAGRIQIQMERMMEAINAPAGKYQEEVMTRKERINAEWKIFNEAMKLMQSSGLIQTATSKVDVDVTLHNEGPKEETLSDLLDRIDDLNKKKNQRKIELQDDDTRTD